MENQLCGLQTPCYILDEDQYRQNIRVFQDSFRSAWGGECVFGYSVKTNHLRWPLQMAREAGFLAEVVSPDEYEYVRGLGVPDAEIIYNGPQKGDTVLSALAAGALVNLDSLEECETVALAAEGGKLDRDVLRVGLRVNFDLEARCPGETTAGREGSRFGICEENGDLGRAVEMLGRAGVSVGGLHMHQSSGTRSLRVFRALAEAAGEAAEKYALGDLTFIDMGGGFFGGNFFPGKPTPPEYADAVCGTLRRRFDPARVTLVLEPGAGILATAMDYLARVIGLRQVRGMHIATLDGTLLHINPFMRPHPVPCTMVNPGPEMAPGEREKWIIAGSTCMEMDRIDPREMPCRPRRGTLFLFHCCGAYMATHNSFFINAAPTIYARRGGEYTLLRRKDPHLMGEW